MANQRVILEGMCDRAEYTLPRPVTGPIVRVAYRDLSLPALPDGRRIDYPVLEVPVTRSYLRAVKADKEPETLKEAFWFTRAVYEHIRRPVWFLFENTLIVYPPPANDGDWVLVEWEEWEFYDCEE